MSRASATSIALIDPMGDLGIGGYTYELAEALAANGRQVDVFAPPTVATRTWRRQHRLVPVLGELLIRQRSALRGTPDVAARSEPGAIESPSPRINMLGPLHRAARPAARVANALRAVVLPTELAAYLRWKGYGLVWTQWPDLGSGDRFWRVARRLGLPLVHTVHNVLPHEPRDGDAELAGRVYGTVDRLIVHSDFARAALRTRFPDVADKVIVAPLGLYTTYPPPPPGTREAMRRLLAVAPETSVVLVFGSIRPYKNLDAVLQALTDPQTGTTTLVVAGREIRYPDLVPGDPLGRTRALAERLGVSARVRLWPGTANATDTAALFAAADIVALPYVESYGSAVLLLAMTFRKHVLVTRTGGMDEYLAGYEAHTMCEGTSAEALARALAAAPTRPRSPSEGRWVHDLSWQTIARNALAAIDAAGLADSRRTRRARASMG